MPVWSDHVLVILNMEKSVSLIMLSDDVDSNDWFEYDDKGLGFKIDKYLKMILCSQLNL